MAKSREFTSPSWFISAWVLLVSQLDDMIDQSREFTIWSWFMSPDNDKGPRSTSQRTIEE